jgi:hypothetical protein
MLRIDGARRVGVTEVVGKHTAELVGRSGLHRLYAQFVCGLQGVLERWIFNLDT